MLDIDPWSLPRVSLKEKKSFPEFTGLYFVFSADNLLYVGKTEDSQGFRGRWKVHHRQKQLEALADVSIAFWVCAERGKALTAIEKLAIQQFEPSLNNLSVPSETSPKNGAASRRLTVHGLGEFHYKWGRLWAYCRGCTLSSLMVNVFADEVESNQKMIKTMLEDVATQRNVSFDELVKNKLSNS